MIVTSRPTTLPRDPQSSPTCSGSPPIHPQSPVNAKGDENMHENGLGMELQWNGHGNGMENGMDMANGPRLSQTGNDWSNKENMEMDIDKEANLTMNNDAATTKLAQTLHTSSIFAKSSPNEEESLRQIKQDALKNNNNIQNRINSKASPTASLLSAAKSSEALPTSLNPLPTSPEPLPTSPKPSSTSATSPGPSPISPKPSSTSSTSRGPLQISPQPMISNRR